MKKSQITMLIITLSSIVATSVVDYGQSSTTVLKNGKMNSSPVSQNQFVKNKPQNNNSKERRSMDSEKLKFGNFSVSLAVKDLKVSKAFYEKLDFTQVGGKAEHNYVIMQNGTTTIGLFQGMFEKNILTFNPGWNHKSESLDQFQDVRELQSAIKKRGISPAKAAEDSGEGPASFVIVDPDGNPILVDQHVAKPK